MRTTRSATRTRPRGRVALVAGVVVVAAVVVVLVAMALRRQDAVQDFLALYPGTGSQPSETPTGLPVWLEWQHFLNALFMVLIIRTGWQVRTTKRPAAMWTRKNTGRFRTRRSPKTISIDLWLHFCLDVLFVVNGVVFFVLLFSTGQWMRVVPTNWDVFPNAVSAALQYASLDWPTENGWYAYNALQLLAYFATVFLAAPLAILTGIRMSTAWPPDARINRVYPVTLARRVHFPVMLYFVVFVIVHVTLVLATGALRNLNHMYGARDDATWVGLTFFVGSLIVMAAAWIAARPILLRPLASLMGRVGR